MPTGATNVAVEPAELLATVPASCTELAAAALGAGLKTAVPTCPEWTVEQLVAHVGRVLRLVEKVLETGGPVDGARLPAPPVGPLVVQWFEQMAAATVEALAATNPDAPMWNWAGQAPLASFWFRRMAHELAVHGADAAIAAGHHPSIESTLAADGIDEFLTVILPAKTAAGANDLRDMGTLHIHCTDTWGEWLLQPSGQAVEVSRVHAKGDAALRGSASDLLLRISNRGNGGEVLGDPSVMARFTDGFRF